MPHPYTAINASAGSGKTHSLVQNILMICLRYPKQETAVRHILALTFTNKAANEMKERILGWLEEFTHENFEHNQKLQSIREEFRKEGLNISLKELHERSQKVLDYILHHYSTLNIGTIDKFNSRLVRSFSYELGLAHQFNLEIQSEPYLIEAVDKMLDNIGDETQVSEAFMDFVNYNLDNDEKISLNKTLYKTAKTFINDVHYDELKKNENFQWEIYEKTKARLREEIKIHKETAKNIAKSALETIAEHHLETGDFADGANGIGGFFKKYLDKEEPLIYDSAQAEENRVEKILKGASSKSKNRQHEIENLLPNLLYQRQELIKNYIEAEKKSKILKELLPLKINREIQEKLTEIEEENDLVLLSKFNILINENLKNEPSAFIYEKIGTQYHHYFFDEFQDTSKMQWENILPLRDHTINSDNHSFTLVGDPKQSIYRFRGGESELMLNILGKKENTNVPVNIENLDRNWRSAKNIVAFNNALYHYISRDLSPEHKELFSAKAEQKPQQNFPGRVKVNLTPYDKKSDVFFENSAAQMQRDIQSCVDNGFALSDITILCRTGKEIQKYSQLLGSKKINYSEDQIYIKTISEKGLTLELSPTLRALTEFFRWETTPKNRQFLVKMLYYLQESGRIKIKDFSEEAFRILKIESHDAIKDYLKENFGLNLSRKGLPNLNLYNYIEYFLQEFSVENKETDFLLTFLETSYNFTQNAGKSLKDFIKFWEEDAHNISIQAAENTDAIKLMTIHSAKGLEFPVVFLPMLNSNKDGKISAWYDVAEMQELKSVNLDAFDKKFSAYDDSVKDFNEKNTYKNLIDRLCLLYVATTRPVEQLFLYIQQPSSSGNHLEIYDYLSSIIPTDAEEFDLYPETENSYRKFSVKEVKHLKTEKIENLANKQKNADAIKIATPSKNYQNRVEKVRTGIFTHEILSKINSEKDVEHILEGYLLEGSISKTEKSEIAERLLAVIRNENYAEYFRENQTVINEKDIMFSADGEAAIYRPDRLIKTDNGYIILDFKTGEVTEKHRKQLETYRDILEKIGRKVIKTEVIYV